MKIEFDENDMKYINNVNDNKIDGGCIPCSELYHEYAIVFEVSDIAKANAFILNLLGNSEQTHQILNNIGISVKELQLQRPVSSGYKVHIKQKLLNDIEEL